MNTRIVGGLDNIVNLMACTLKTCMRDLRQERRQDTNSSPTKHTPTQGENSTKFAEDEALSDQLK